MNEYKEYKLEKLELTTNKLIDWLKETDRNVNSKILARMLEMMIQGDWTSRPLFELNVFYDYLSEEKALVNAF